MEHTFDMVMENGFSYHAVQYQPLNYITAPTKRKTLNDPMEDSSSSDSDDPSGNYYEMRDVLRRIKRIKFPVFVHIKVIQLNSEIITYRNAYVL